MNITENEAPMCMNKKIGWLRLSIKCNEAAIAFDFFFNERHFLEEFHGDLSLLKLTGKLGWHVTMISCDIMRCDQLERATSPEGEVIAKKNTEHRL